MQGVPDEIVVAERIHDLRLGVSVGASSIDGRNNGRDPQRFKLQPHLLMPVVSQAYKIIECILRKGSRIFRVFSKSSVTGKNQYETQGILYHWIGKVEIRRSFICTYWVFTLRFEELYYFAKRVISEQANHNVSKLKHFFLCQLKFNNFIPLLF